MEYTKQKPLRAALAGNPNCGKTTLFNRLTGSDQVVGNWPGVTVERKTGLIETPHGWLELVDLPGVYSLDAYSPEEKITGDFLRGGNADVILNIIDLTNPERNLYLTLQLLALGLPMAAAFNMLDVLERQGGTFDAKVMSRLLGVAAIPVSASKGDGLDALLETVFRTAESGKAPFPPLSEGSAYSRRLSQGAPPRPLPDGEALLAGQRYDRAEELVKACIRRPPRPAFTASDRIDQLATHRVLAIPIFLLLVFSLFFVTFGPPGNALVSLVDRVFAALSTQTQELLTASHASPWACSLVLDGLLSPMGAVFRFLPQILLLFSLLSVLEDSGYMARAAFIMDAPMRKLGLSGRAFVPLLMGFGCTVPAVMGTRILEREKDKRLTILILPFMSCSAKMPVYSLFLSAFFAGNRPAVIFLLYAFGVGMAVLSALFFKKTILKGEPATFVMELPPYRFPTLSGVWLRVRQRLGDFLRRAGSVLLCAALAVWALRSFSPSLTYVTDSAQSILALLGGVLAPLFTWCGFPDWKPVVALLTGLVAKESVVSTMGVLYGGNLTSALQAAFTPLSAFAYLLFVLLYTPCAAALAAVRREMGSLKWTLVTVFWQLAAAWYCSALFYQGALLVKYFTG